MFRLVTALILLFVEQIDAQGTATPTVICPERYETRGSSCYQLVQSKLRYHDANNMCVGDLAGGTLACIDDSAEEQYIWRQFYNVTRQFFWIGLSDNVQEGIFLWEDGGSLSYSNWARGQPSTVDGRVNSALSNCVVYNGSGWLLANCVTPLFNYLCEAPMCESVDGVVCAPSEQPSVSPDNASSSSTLLIIVVVIIILLVLTAVVMVVLFVIYKKYNGAFMKYLCCCYHVNQGEVLSLQQENQRLRHELSQHKLQLSASPSRNELTRGWSRLSGIPDGQGGYLPAIRQSPMEPTSAWNDMPRLNKSISGSKIAPFVVSPAHSPTLPLVNR